MHRNHLSLPPEASGGEMSRSYTYGLDVIQAGRQKSCELTSSPSQLNEGPAFIFGSSRGSKSAPSSPYVKRIYRLVVVGSAQTGKTSILDRFLQDKFSDTYCPTIENFHRKIYKIKGDHYQLDILDIGGLDPFPAARRLTLLNGDLFAVVCAMDRAESFQEAIRLREELMDLKGGATPVPILIVLNKVDLPPGKHAISLKEAISKVGQFEDSGFVHCSAKLGHGIQELFAQLFHLGRLPKQMSPFHYQPAHHTERDSPSVHDNSPQDDPPRSPKSAVSKLRKSVRTKFLESAEPECYDEECARRPSLRTDLLALRSRSSAPLFLEPKCNKETAPKKKCSIQ